MTKEEAITAMQKGIKITHEYFTSDEWMTMNAGKIHLEDGVVCSPNYFWQWRTDDTWNTGYKLYKET